MSLIASAPAAEEPAMIVPVIAPYKIELTEGSLLERKATVEVLQDIVKVETAKDREEAIAALGLAKGMIKKFVASKDELKEPALRICQKIDKLAKDYQDTVKVELARVEALTNAYTLEEQKRIEALRSQEMAEIKLANVNADMDTLRANAEREIELNQKLKVEGARTQEYWEYEILPGGLAELAQQRPDLVIIEPRRRDILAAISNGALLPGMRVFRQVKVMAKAS